MEKSELLRHLKETYQRALETLQTADPEQVIYEESGWRVKDIIAHVATWDTETLHSLHAFRRGGEYHIADYTNADDFNAYAAHVRMDEPTEQIYAGWDATVKWLQIIVGALTPEELSAEMTYPSGKRGQVAVLIQEIYEHQDEHLNHIRTALSSS